MNQNDRDVEKVGHCPDCGNKPPLGMIACPDCHKIVNGVTIS